MKKRNSFYKILILFGLLSSILTAQDKPQIVEHVFLKDGQIIEKAGIGDVTVELKFSMAMNTAVVPEIHYSLSNSNFTLVLPARGAWESTTLWQGSFTISSNLPSTGDGLYYFRVNGAESVDAAIMDSVVSNTTLEICRPDVRFSKSLINLGYFLSGNTVQVPLEISNPGCDKLTISSVSVGAPFFVTNIAPNHVIPSESSFTINVGITTNKRARWDDTVTVVIPQLRPNTYKIPVSAISHGPQISISPADVDFGDVELGSDSTRRIVVFNHFAADSSLSDTLTIYSESSSAPAVFSISAYSRTIAPGDSSILFITFKPNKALRYIGYFINLQNSDAVQKNARIPVRGRGIDNDPPPQIPGLEINWNTAFAGYTNSDSIRLCWQQVTESSGISEIRWKFSQEPKAPITNTDLGLGGAIDLDESTTCVYIPLRSRLTNGRWYCYLWFVDGAGNSGYTSPVKTVLNYDTRIPGAPTLLERNIEISQWFSPQYPFNLRFLLPRTTTTGRNDIEAVRWTYGNRPGSATDYDRQQNLGAHDDTVTVTIPFDDIECGEDSLFVWLVDSTGNSSANNVTIIPYSYDGCPPVITRLDTQETSIGDIGAVFKDTVLIEDESSISEAIVYYRFGGAEAEEPPARATRIAESDSFVILIPQGAMTRRGLEYRLKATDQFGQFAFGPASKNACTSHGEIWFPIRTRVSDQGNYAIDSHGNPLPLKSGTELSHYQMISVPYAIDSASVSSVLDDDLGKYDNTSWRFFDYVDGTAQNPWVEGYKSRDFEPGRSFFIITNQQDIVFDAGRGTTVATVCPDTLTLNEGWNFIATPFAFPVHKSSLRLVNSTTNLTLRSYVAGWDITNILEPWMGYALYVVRETANLPIYLIIQPDAIESNARKIKPAPAVLAVGEWNLKVAAQAGEFTDNFNWLGQNRNAADQFDAFDLAEPPGIGQYVALSFPHADWQQPATEFSADFRATQNVNQQWQIEIKSTVPGEAIYLQFDLQGHPASGQLICLVDEEVGLKIDLRQQTQYTLPALENATMKSLKIISGSRSFIEENTAQLAEIPQAYNLAQNFPNPFNPETSISFRLPQKSHVQIAIYDQLGRLVRLLADEEKAAGYHKTFWKGINNAGQQLPSGVYFLQMRSGKFNQTRKMLLLR